MRRRDGLIFLALAGVALAIPPLLRHRAERFAFEDLEGMPEFRRLVRGPTSAGPPMFVGLRTAEEAAADAALNDNLCQAVFGPEPWSKLPIVVFSDYFCPYCASLERRLVALEDEGLPIEIRFRQLPLLGPRSRDLAKVALAAQVAGDARAIHIDLMTRGLRPGPAALRDFAQRHGLDPTALAQSVQSDDMASEVEMALALGRALGLPGTPSFFVGRTLVIGNLPENELRALIALEAERGVSSCA